MNADDAESSAAAAAALQRASAYATAQETVSAAEALILQAQTLWSRWIGAAPKHYASAATLFRRAAAQCKAAERWSEAARSLRSAAAASLDADPDDIQSFVADSRDAARCCIAANNVELAAETLQRALQHLEAQEAHQPSGRFAILQARILLDMKECRVEALEPRGR